ncbi:choline dehydrogenase [Spectribacter hydrogenoxidans]|uniref:Choline dehydrogenase n=1 Tax=Spectribacter hydrogenoxidans TaxID=3075608 RepID=A0ABU3BX88_9GAMM|nr:choline dehydrogenase [Salinisphaera sp. W335]MDT0633928.1 choline dehydrogenase [Salinisphaera sp. W335]
MSHQQHFDYVIVGGGSAGCVLANRLSADPDVSVCLLEAGPSDRWNPFIRIPVGVIAMMWGRTYNWAFRTESQKNLNDRELFWPRGKTLGGSSAVNAMCYTRGDPSDYDRWAELGNRGWGYRDLLPYFRMSENFEAGENEYHGEGGGYNVAQLRETNPLSDVFLKAAEECGFPANNDFSGATDEGFGYYHVAQKDGRRCSNAHAFLHPVARRPNLTILTRARGLKVLVEGKRAVGVTVKRKGRLRPNDIRADREVILAGGAINSPQLLLLSGIGPREEIEPHGIEPVHELPGVGRNLQDHLDITLIHRERTRLGISLHPRWLLTRGLPALIRYFLGGRRGALTSNVAEAGGFVKLRAEDPVCSLQCHFLPAIEQDHGHNLWNTFRYYGYSLRICDLRPRSRGHIGLRSAAPSDDPLIQPNYLDQKPDLDHLVAAVKLGRRLLDSDAFAPHRRDEFKPGAAVQSDNDIREFIRAEAETIYHPVGTCRMGPDPAEAVVDDRLRVHGMRGLRVVDASIMPTLVGSNTNAPTTAIAEKAAVMILEDQGSDSGHLRAA